MPYISVLLRSQKYLLLWCYFVSDVCNLNGKLRGQRYGATAADEPVTSVLMIYFCISSFRRCVSRLQGSERFLEVMIMKGSPRSETLNQDPTMYARYALLAPLIREVHNVWSRSSSRRFTYENACLILQGKKYQFFLANLSAFKIQIPNVASSRVLLCWIGEISE